MRFKWKLTMTNPGKVAIQHIIINDLVRQFRGGTIPDQCGENVHHENVFGTTVLSIEVHMTEWPIAIVGYCCETTRA
jgi:hypothetical protein